MGKTDKLKATKGYKVRRLFLDRNSNLIKSLYPNTKTIYGPYLNKDGRYRVVMYTFDKRRFTTQYCCIKIEVKLERRLVDDETVDHKNNKIRDDRYDNLRVLPRSEHSRQDIERIMLQTVKCVWCKGKFKSKVNDIRRTKDGKLTAGPFCSGTCRGKYGASISNGGPKLERVSYKRKKYRLKDSFI